MYVALFSRDVLYCLKFIFKWFIEKEGENKREGGREREVNLVKCYKMVNFVIRNMDVCFNNLLIFI